MITVSLVMKTIRDLRADMLQMQPAIISLEHSNCCAYDKKDWGRFCAEGDEVEEGKPMSQFNGYYHGLN